MEATKDYISLDTAKLLKDCGIKNKHFYIELGEHVNVVNDYFINKFSLGTHNYNAVPAFTWQEILWEYPEKFFGKECTDDFSVYGEDIYSENGYSKLYSACYSSGIEWTPIKYKGAGMNILFLLQQKKYKEADLYFRDNCILINNQK